MRGSGDLFYRTRENRLIDLRRRVETAQLPYELYGGVTDFSLGGGRLEVKQRLDVPAHIFTLGSRTPPYTKARVTTNLTASRNRSARSCSRSETATAV